jgi:hypothetical protein
VITNREVFAARMSIFEGEVRISIEPLTNEDIMNHYLLSIIQPDGSPPANIGEIMRDVHAVNAELKAAGAWVFNRGLTPASSATIVRTRVGDPELTDGPFVEAKEHVGGIIVVAAKDLDGALAWARKYSKATTLPIEVRAFVDG